MWERKYFNTYGGLPGDLIISDIIPEILRIRDWRVMLDARGGGGGPGGNDRWWMTTGDRLADTHIAWRTKDRGQKKELFGKDKDIQRRKGGTWLMISPVELVCPVLEEELQFTEVFIWPNSPGSSWRSSQPTDLHQLLLTELLLAH